jgi:hypothetical protein
MVVALIEFAAAHLAAKQASSARHQLTNIIDVLAIADRWIAGHTDLCRLKMHEHASRRCQVVRELAPALLEAGLITPDFHQEIIETIDVFSTYLTKRRFI